MLKNLFAKYILKKSPALAPPCGLDKKWGHWWITAVKALRSQARLGFAIKARINTG
jgi:hypothetical protein